MSERRSGPIVLVGYRATGKSTVAPRVARALGWESIDLDELITVRAGRSIREIFALQGEEAFRDLEAQVFADVVDQRPKSVVAAGGGLVIRPENRSRLLPLPVVWLRAAPETILRRLALDPTTHASRPALTQLSPDEEVRQLLKQREPLYRSVAKLSLDTDEQSPEALAAKIVAWWQELQRST